jgi:4-hydroxy-4-methyl-2-oxoglutarate aldolase
MAVVAQDLIERLRRLEVSTLCDADKTLPVVDGAVHAIVANARMVGVARTAVAEDDHLSVITALAGAGPDDVLVVTTNGHVRAVLGELLAHEAHRRGLAGIVIDGHCRDVTGLRGLGLPVFARGSHPASGTAVRRTGVGEAIVCGGVAVSPGDVVVGDDDGIVIAPPARIAAALDAAEDRAVAEQAMLAAIRGGASYHDLSGFADHLARLDRGEDSRLEFRAHGG